MAVHSYCHTHATVPLPLAVVEFESVLNILIPSVVTAVYMCMHASLER